MDCAACKYSRQIEYCVRADITKYRAGTASPLQQPCPSMILEVFGIPDIAPQRIDRAVAAHIHHLEDRGLWASTCSL
jgi:hypothetical protein